MGEISVQANWYRQSEMQVTDINDPNGVVPAYHVYNLYADWQEIYRPAARCTAVGAERYR